MSQWKFELSVNYEEVLEQEDLLLVREVASIQVIWGSHYQDFQILLTGQTPVLL